MANSRKEPKKIQLKDRNIIRKVTLRERNTWDSGAKLFDKTHQHPDYLFAQYNLLISLQKFITSLQEMYKSNKFEVLEDPFVDTIIMLLEAMNKQSKNYSLESELKFANEKINLLTTLLTLLPNPAEVELTHAESKLIAKVKLYINNYRKLLEDQNQRVMQELVPSPTTPSFIIQNLNIYNIVIPLPSIEPDVKKTSIKRKKVTSTAQQVNAPKKFSDNDLRDYFRKHPKELFDIPYDVFFGETPEGYIPPGYKLINMFVENAKKKLIKQAELEPVNNSLPLDIVSLPSKIIAVRNSSFCYLSSFERIQAVLQLKAMDFYSQEPEASLPEAMVAKEVAIEKQKAFIAYKKHGFDVDEILNDQKNHIQLAINIAFSEIKQKNYLNALTHLHVIFSDSSDLAVRKLMLIYMLHAGNLLCEDLRKTTETTLVRLTNYIHTHVDPEVELLKSDLELARATPAKHCFFFQQPTAAVLRHARALFPEDEGRFPDPEKISHYLPKEKKEEKQPDELEGQSIKRSKRISEKKAADSYSYAKFNPKLLSPYVHACVLLQRPNVDQLVHHYISKLQLETLNLQTLKYAAQDIMLGTSQPTSRELVKSI